MNKELLQEISEAIKASQDKLMNSNIDKDVVLVPILKNHFVVTKETTIEDTECYIVKYQKVFLREGDFYWNFTNITEQ